MTDSDSDDSFITNAGLTVKRSQRNKRNAIKRQLEKLGSNVQRTEAKRQQTDAMARLKVEEDVTDEVEETLQQHRDVGYAQRARELDSRLDGADSEAEDGPMQRAMQTSLSSLLGTRPTLRRNDAVVPDWGTLVGKIQDKPLKKYCGDIKDELIPMMLESQILATKFNTFPDCLVDWLFETACTCSNLSQGAFMTLEAYWQKTKGAVSSLHGFLEQGEKNFLAGQQGQYRAKDDIAEDISHWMRLWELRIVNAKPGELDAQTVSKALVLLAKLSLDPSFSWQTSLEDRSSGSFCSLIASLLKHIPLHDADSWIRRTCVQILTIQIPEAPKGSEDANDVSGHLARALLVENFVSHKFPWRFCTVLVEQAMEKVLGIPAGSWEERLKTQARQEREEKWLFDKHGTSIAWRNMVNIYTSLLAFEDDQDILFDAPKCLAIVWNLRSCTTLVQFDQGFVHDLDANVAVDVSKMYGILENRTSLLIKPLARLSTQPHYSRSETLLQILKTHFARQREGAMKAAGMTETVSAQTSMRSYFKSKLEGDS